MKPTPCFVYVLGTIDQSNQRTYVGWSNDLEARLIKHNEGKGAKSTRGRKWHLLYAEAYKTRGAAMSREWHLKRDRKLKQLLLSNWVTSIG